MSVLLSAQVRLCVITYRLVHSYRRLGRTVMSLSTETFVAIYSIR